jgi:FkbM family methyltransferase
MNDLTKNRIERVFKRFGIRVSKARYYKFEYDRENYPLVAIHPRPVIFDVGANIGQSAIWFSKSFPSAHIYAFEPVPSVFKRLQREVAGRPAIETLNLACGQRNEQIRIPALTSELIQTVQVLSGHVGGTGGDAITVTTVDSFCEARGIASIQILKTDTEGYDLEVLNGARRMLSAASIDYVLSEVSIVKGDRHHTDLFALKEFLERFGFTLHSFYDIHHVPEDGATDYFNALFKRNAPT